MPGQTKGRYKLVMNEALAMPGGYIVPKGNPGGRDNAMKFIATAQSLAARQELFACLGMTLASPEAFTPDLGRRCALCDHPQDEHRQGGL